MNAILQRPPFQSLFSALEQQLSQGVMLELVAEELFGAGDFDDDAGRLAAILVRQLADVNAYGNSGGLIELEL